MVGDLGFERVGRWWNRGRVAIAIGEFSSGVWRPHAHMAEIKKCLYPNSNTKDEEESKDE